MLKTIINNLKSLDVSKIVLEAIEETAYILADYNREQLTAGFDSDGKRLEAYKEYGYAEFKVRLNPVPGFGNPDLKLTGAFHESIKVRVESNKVTVISDDSKSIELQAKYGNAILGLSENALDYYIKVKLTPILQQKFIEAWINIIRA